MSKYIIEISGEYEEMLNRFATEKHLSPEQFIEEIVNRYLPLSHKIDQETMAKGYVDMAEINLEIAK